METMQYRLGSVPMCSAPGIIRWAINGYKFKKDRDAILNVILAWDIPEQVAKDLLSEKVPYTVEDETVVIEVAA
jgi:hypothetical protein